MLDSQTIANRYARERDCFGDTGTYLYFHVESGSLLKKSLMVVTMYRDRNAPRSAFWREKY